jgi:hypothetical protein
MVKLEISRFPCKERPYMPGSQTTRGQTVTRHSVSVCVAFHDSYRVSTPEKITYAAQWLACTLPCRRFTDTLADAGARLGADADRYSFTVADSHRLLLAGLPAHNRLISEEKVRPLE